MKSLDFMPWNVIATHYSDVIMTTMASQITSLTVVYYSTVYSDADQRKHQSSASLAFVRGIHRDRWIPRTKGQFRGKCFHLMTSSWFCTWCYVFISISLRLMLHVALPVYIFCFIIVIYSRIIVLQTVIYSDSNKIYQFLAYFSSLEI